MPFWKGNLGTVLKRSVRNVLCMADPVAILYLLRTREFSMVHLKTMACGGLCTCRKVNFHESENGNKISKVQLFWELKSFGESSRICFCFVALLSVTQLRSEFHYSRLRCCTEGAVPLPKHKYLIPLNTNSLNSGSCFVQCKWRLCRFHFALPVLCQTRFGGAVAEQRQFPRKHLHKWMKH